MTEKRYTVRYVAEGGRKVLSEFDAITGKARSTYEEVRSGTKSAAASAAVFDRAIEDQAAAAGGQDAGRKTSERAV